MRPVLGGVYAAFRVYPSDPDYVGQDQCVVQERFNEYQDQMFFGVFDGHGDAGGGDRVSRECMVRA